MTTKLSAGLFVLSSVLDDIVLENYFVKSIKPGDELSMNYVSKTTFHHKKHIRLLNEMSDDLYSVEWNTVKITQNADVLTAKTKNYIRGCIKKHIYPSQYPEDSFEHQLGKIIFDNYYTEHEINFVEEIYNQFLEISHLDLDNNNLQLPPDETIMQFNMLNLWFFHYTARNIYNAILQRTLHAGDDLIEFLQKYCEKKIGKQKFPILLQLSKIYDWFFEADNNKIILRCDFETNKTLFIKNFINIVIFCFHDNNVKLKLLKKLYVKNGSLLRRKEKSATELKSIQD